MAKRGRPKYPDLLTPREQEVLALIRAGLTNPQIAERLGIGVEGVKYHVSEILGKLGVASRDEAALWHEGTRPWWLGGVIAMWRPPLRAASIALAGGVVVAAVAGLVLLAVLLVRGDDSGDEQVDSIGADAPFRIDGPRDPQEALADETFRSRVWMYVLDTKTGLIYAIRQLALDGDPDASIGPIRWNDDQSLLVQTYAAGKTRVYRASLDGAIASVPGATPEGPPIVSFSTDERWLVSTLGKSIASSRGSGVLVGAAGEEARYRITNAVYGSWSHWCKTWRDRQRLFGL